LSIPYCIEVNSTAFFISSNKVTLPFECNSRSKGFVRGCMASVINVRMGFLLEGYFDRYTVQ
jgi:hypothetical protein